MTDHYAVIGNPIAHSKSPLIHAEFARQTAQDVAYGRIFSEAGVFSGDVRRFIANGGQGLNVTVPFKGQAWEMADELSERAERAGAVNTIIRLPDGRLRGDNTDGVGLIRDLEQNQRFDFAAKRVLLIGAGGASRGVLDPLVNTKMAALVIANRTVGKALDLAETVGKNRVSGCGLDGLDGRCFDLIINATSIGFDGGVPALPNDCLAPGGWTYDMLYGEEPTAFVLWGRARGAARALDGLGMLVEQAAESFFLWRHVRPSTAPVIASLRGE